MTTRVLRLSGTFFSEDMKSGILPKGSITITNVNTKEKKVLNSIKMPYF